VLQVELPSSIAGVPCYPSKLLKTKEGYAVRVMSRRTVICIFASVVASPIATSISSSAGGRTLAIKGYDPVAYFKLGKPTLGLPEFEYEWDEHRYRFSSAEHRDLFKADPLRYAPQFANFCTMALTRGKVVEANPEYWLISGGNLFVFSQPLGPELFQQALVENLNKATQNRALIHKR
jgi:hypothetical protein